MGRPTRARIQYVVIVSTLRGQVSLVGTDADYALVTLDIDGRHHASPVGPAQGRPPGMTGARADGAKVSARI